MQENNYSSSKEFSNPLWMQKELLASQTLREISSIANNLRQEEEEDDEVPSRNSMDTNPKLSNGLMGGPQTNVIVPSRFPDDLLDVAKTLEELKTNSESPIPKKRSSTEIVNPIASEDISNTEVKTKPKKRRRKRDEIERSFKCPINGCTKSYGSEGALKTHVKLKHSVESIPGSNSPNVYAKVRTNDFSWQKVLANRNEPKLINGTPSSIASLPASLPTLRGSPTNSIANNTHSPQNQSPVQNVTTTTTTNPNSTFSSIALLSSQNANSNIKLQLPYPKPPANPANSTADSHPTILPPLMSKESSALFYNFVKESGVTRI
jgi:hypothetical protein